jgi:hypothetical protein
MRIRNRQDRINLLLFAVVLVLGALVWLTLEQARPTGREPLTGLDPTRVQRITIRNDRAAFTLEHKEERWRMTSPRETAANEERIRRLLKLLGTPSLERFPVPPGGLEAFGLAQPRASVQFDDTRIWLGGTHPYSDCRYLRVGDTIHLIKDIFPHHFLARGDEFVATPEQRSQ